MSQAVAAGPNPLCEVGRTHPRDRHRMRPVADHPGVWECAKHEIFATIVPKAEADALARGDDFPMHTGGAGAVIRHGDDRAGGVLIYYRAA